MCKPETEALMILNGDLASADMDIKEIFVFLKSK